MAANKTPDYLCSNHKQFDFLPNISPVPWWREKHCYSNVYFGYFFPASSAFNSQHFLSHPVFFCFLWFFQISQLCALQWNWFSEVGYNLEELIMNSLKNFLEYVCALNPVLSQQHFHPSVHDLTLAPMIYSRHIVLQWAHSISSTLSGNNKLNNVDSIEAHFNGSQHAFLL